MCLHHHISARCDADGCREVLFLGSYDFEWRFPDDFTATLESLDWSTGTGDRLYCPQHGTDSPCSVS